MGFQIDLVVAEYHKMDWKTLGWGSYIANLGFFGLLKTIKKFERAGQFCRSNRMKRDRINAYNVINGQLNPNLEELITLNLESFQVK